MNKKKRLGRGLDALLSRPAAEASGPPAAAAETVGDTLRNIPVDLLQRGRYQPRVDMRQESLEDLASSIRAQGVVQPIVARPLSNGGGTTRYEIIAGERRWRAAQMAGLQEIPAVVRDVPDEGAIAMALIENIQRENLNPLEEARALDRLIREFELTHQAAAEAVGRSRAAVSNLLRLLELSDKVKAMLEARELEMGHARALLPLTDKGRQHEIAQQIVHKGLSVREAEALVRRITGGKSKKPPAAAPDADVRRLEVEIADKLGAKVRIEHKARGMGQLVIAYNNLDELDGILKHIR
ncbi:MAG TPA: ParB/RepB/Spo0J family partition protein [Woeseiaceae bacterium]|nr:ParB/RepB/Spo0J family partition protein [Woeseiaceae bacterium]